jgi:hypothetical protein
MVHLMIQKGSIDNLSGYMYFDIDGLIYKRA